MCAALGAHDLILHILEPSLQQRATLRDIAMHHWLEDRPRQDSGSPCVIPWPETNGDVSPSGGRVKLRRDRSSENLGSSLPEFDGSCTSSNNCRTLSPAASSFYDSLSVREGDRRSLPVSTSRSPDFIPVDSEQCWATHSARDEVITGDYVPLCDVAVDHSQRLSGGITCKEYSRDSSCDDQLISTPHIPSDFCFHPSSSCVSHHHYSVNCNALSDADHIVATGALSTTAETTLPVSFSADSLELLADKNSSVDTSSDDEDEDETSNNGKADNNHCGNYDLADIDAVLDHIARSVGCATANADASSLASYDSLEDAT